MVDEAQASSAAANMQLEAEQPLLQPALEDATGVPRRGAPSRMRQFGAVLRKNYLLQTRSRRMWWGGVGWLALLIEVSYHVYSVMPCIDAACMLGMHVPVAQRDAQMRHPCPVWGHSQPSLIGAWPSTLCAEG